MNDLRCLWCGGKLWIEQETKGATYLSYETPESIECTESWCGAVWDPDGTLRTPGNRWPDLRPVSPSEATRGGETRQPPPLPLRGDLLLRPLAVDDPTPPGWTRCCYRICTGNETTDDVRNWQIVRPAGPSGREGAFVTFTSETSKEGNDGE